jgi:hypothetical protein
VWSGRIGRTDPACSGRMIVFGCIIEMEMEMNDDERGNEFM